MLTCDISIVICIPFELSVTITASCIFMPANLKVAQLQAHLASQEHGIKCGQRFALTHNLFRLYQ